MIGAMRTGLLLAIALTLSVFAVLTNVKASEKAPRMQFLGAQDMPDTGAMFYARYLHDTETKQEIVCFFAFVHGDGVMSCYPTGRTW